MILLKDGEAKTILTDEESEFLARAYLKLQKSKTFKSFTKTFQDYVNEFLSDQLKNYQAVKIIGGKYDREVK